MMRVSSVTFKEGNNVLYGQDFTAHRGVPAGIKFRVKDAGNNYQLTAPGYGQLSPVGAGSLGPDYGNGAIYISKETVHGKQVTRRRTNETLSM